MRPRRVLCRQAVQQGEDAITEKNRRGSYRVILASKGAIKANLVYETADLWFHCMVLLAKHRFERGRCAERIGAPRRAVRYRRKRKPQEGLNMGDCIFCKIARGEIPCRKVYEDEECWRSRHQPCRAGGISCWFPKLHLASLAESRRSACSPARQDAAARTRTGERARLGKRFPNRDSTPARAAGRKYFICISTSSVAATFRPWCGAVSR